MLPSVERASVLALAFLATCHRSPGRPGDHPASATSAGMARPSVELGEHFAPSAAPAPPEIASSRVIREIPAPLVESLAGCWQTEEPAPRQERWEFRRVDAVIQVVRRISSANRELSPDWARRAALPTSVLYHARTSELAFATAGRIHAMMFVFRLEADRISGYWYSRHSPDQEYHATGGQSVLRRCE
jgi:hypothetical protein